MASTLAGPVPLSLLLTPLGFTLGILGLLVILFACNPEHAVAKLVVALAGSAGLCYVLECLRLALPSASLPVLRSLGL